MGERRTWRPVSWLIYGLLVILVLALLAAFIWRDDILRTSLDPKEPFQTYDPPPAPDYGREAAWYMRGATPGRPSHAQGAGPGAADVLFIGPTTYDGGRHWNAPIGEADTDKGFQTVMAPNYLGPFARTGRLFAPRYRQASLYSQLTLRDDAREARRFSYGDVLAAYREYRDHLQGGRPFVLVGVEQGGLLAARLLQEEIVPDRPARERLVAAYLIETVIPRDALPLPACATPVQTGCIAAWASAFQGDPERLRQVTERALVWDGRGQLEDLAGRRGACFNPLLGRETTQPAPARLHLGGANATGLEWGARPAFLARQVSAACEDGVLKVSRPRSQTFRSVGSWADHRKAPGYNLFYADLEADVARRTAAFAAPGPAPR